MSRCIVMNIEITSENDSAAHVIPSALGGRLKPKGFLSKQGNELLNDKVDAPLIRTLGPFMTLLGGSRDRGENAPVQMTSGGKKYLISFGEPIKLAGPEYVERQEGGSVFIEIHARTMKEARQLLGRVKSTHADFDVEQAIACASHESIYLPDKLGGRINLGPNPLFPAMFAMANVYAASLGLPRHEAFPAYVFALPDRVKFEPEGQEVNIPMPPDTFYWLPTNSPVQRPPGVTHIIGYYGDPVRRQALFFVELFNLPSVAVVLPYEASVETSSSYAIDVVTGAQHSVDLDPMAYEGAWSSTHQVADLFGVVQERVGRVLALAMQRMQDREVERIITEVVGDATVFTADHIAVISSRVAELAARMIANSTDID